MINPPSAARRHHFVNVNTGESIHMDLHPELDDHDILKRTIEGLILLSHKEAPHGVCLLNPLTRQLTDLPPLATVLTPEERNNWKGGGGVRGGDLQVRGVALADESTVVVYLIALRTLAVAKIGDDSWTKIALAHKLRLYFTTLPVAHHVFHASARLVMPLCICHVRLRRA
uniref:KIB1-4 beta-propeller domain-containing protein n=1 Tax=Leersia perrieri TaxID=77586 RepID=A0A0D9X0L8_9ORYZ